MLASRHLAFDLGAESGRALLGSLDDGRLAVREIHRFPNGMLRLRGHCHWNLYRLFEQVKEGLRLAARAGDAPQSIGVDTWGVDFGLLDRDGDLLGLPYAYRDSRTAGAMDSFFRKVPRERVYELTGVQFLPFNSLFQLESMVRDRSPLIEAAADLLFMPDLFHYLLAGAKATEFTFATTSQLFNPRTGGWDDELLAALGLPRRWLQPLVAPGTPLGPLGAEIAAETGLAPIPLIAVATHDTASAVAAAPGEGDDWAYLSSGTWSLLGVESPAPLIGDETRRANFTNEGGVGGSFRVLKNVMGLWLVQECRRAWSRDAEIDYDELTAAAAAAPPWRALVDPDNASFLNPPDMPAAIRDFCRRTDQPVPETPGAVVRCALESLALKYRCVLEELGRIYPRPIRRLHAIGGGARNRLLNQWTADATGLPVLAGPTEATAIGNLLVQAMALGRVGSLAELRDIVRRSFPLETYTPRPTPAWEAAWRRFQQFRLV
jgi:rhamnulokinase